MVVGSVLRGVDGGLLGIRDADGTGGLALGEHVVGGGGLSVLHAGADGVVVVVGAVLRGVDGGLLGRGAGGRRRCAAGAECQSQSQCGDPSEQIAFHG